MKRPWAAYRLQHSDVGARPICLRSTAADVFPGRAPDLGGQSPLVALIQDNGADDKQGYGDNDVQDNRED